MKKIISLVFIGCSSAFNPHPFINPAISAINLAVSSAALKKIKTLDINANITRKAIHIASAPSFIATWGLYNDNNPQLWAASVPLITSVYLFYKKDSLGSIISRSGNSEELLKGPMIYTTMLALLTTSFWTDDPTGIIAMTQLAVGDGFADIVGRRYGSLKWPYNPNKSLEGTLGFLIASFLGTNTAIFYFNEILHYSYDYSPIEVFIISLICALVETIPGIDDNISIPCAVILIGFVKKIYHYQY